MTQFKKKKKKRKKERKKERKAGKIKKKKSNLAWHFTHQFYPQLEKCQKTKGKIMTKCVS